MLSSKRGKSNINFHKTKINNRYAGKIFRLANILTVHTYSEALAGYGALI